VHILDARNGGLGGGAVKPKESLSEVGVKRWLRRELSDPSSLSNRGTTSTYRTGVLYRQPMVQRCLVYLAARKRKAVT